MFEEVAFMPLLFFFPSILYNLVIILWLTDESQLANHYCGLAKVNDLICYSQTIIYTYIHV